MSGKLIANSALISTQRFCLFLVFANDASGKSVLNDYEIIDLTHEVAENYTLQWPTATRFDFKIISRGQTNAGYYYEGNDFSQSEHSGTHTDAPAHFFKNRWRIGQIPLERLSGPGIVIDISHKSVKHRDAQLTLEDITDWEDTYGRIPDNSIVLMNSGSSKLYKDPKRYFGYPDEEKFKLKDVKHLHFPGVHPDATDFLVNKRSIIGLGVDTPSTDYGQSKDFETHQILGSANVWGLENVANVDRIPPKGATIFNMVYKLKEGSGAPSRVIAQLPKETFGKNICKNWATSLESSGLKITLFIIWHCKPGSNILATAPSNAAADLLAQRLIKHVPKSQILRYYAPTRHEKEIPEDLRCVSNLKLDCTNQSTVLKCRVVVVTLITAGRLVSAGIPEKHFSHAFIDEAGHAMEPEACVAISGMLEYPHGQLILAGDPKQLGPVLRSPVALKCGLQISLLERLMMPSNSSNSSATLIYQRDLDTGKYNNKAITKLLSNFRSHPALLNLPSKLFYDGELLPNGDPIVTTSLEGWEKLNNSKFPMIFHGIVGEDKREARSPSFFNAEEAVTVVDYIQDLLTTKKGISKKILPKEIGVISPYRRQVEKIKSLMNRRFQNSGGKSTGGNGKYIEGIPENWKEVTVGSTEEFQGQERRIIIITTVRSQPDLLQHDFKHKLGFLRNPKRFNVAITRAKALLIVVGNPNLLSLDSHWREFIRYSIENGGYTGVHFNLPPEVSSGVEKGVSRDCIDQMQDLELLDMERKFRDMGFAMDESESSDSDESDLLDSFEKLDMDEITQESQEWRTEY